MTSEIDTLVSRLESVTTRLEKIADSQQGTLNSSQEETMAPFVVAYDDIVNGPLRQFLSLSAVIGGEVKQQSEIVASSFKAQRDFLITASNSKEPAQNVLMNLLKPTSDCIIAVQEFREKNRASKFFNHLSAISESISALGWVTVSPAPSPFVKEMSDASQFYANRVLKDYKDKDKTHSDWVRAWLQVLSELQAYIKQFHTIGLSWNAKGAAAALPAPGGPGAPPPPPPPPPPADLFMGAGDASDDTRAALFKEINQGADITRSLKKVTSDQQTHKNPALRQAPAPYKPPPTGPRPFKPVTAPGSQTKPAKPPRFELEGKKWCVEFQNGNKGLVISQPEMNQSICVYQCHDCLIQVQGKVNSITVDSCKKTAIVFGDTVSVVEFINCQSMQAQTLGRVPTITVDKTDGVQIFLSDKSLDIEIVSSKSSEINVSVPQPNGDFTEYPVPEQFKSTITSRGLKTEVVEKA